MILRYLSSTVGKKAVMAVTGMALFLFIVGHMLGNLKVFSGIDPVTQRYKIDVYGEWLREIGYPVLSHGQFLWMARIGLLVVLAAHVTTAIRLTLLNRKARAISYSKFNPVATNYAARTMIWGGIIILLFVVYHIAHLTLGIVGPAGFKHGAVHSNLVLAFGNFYLVALYLLAQLALCCHLYHGIWSLCQSLGVTRPGTQKCLQKISKGAAIAIFIGYVSVPLSIFFGFVR